MTFQLFKTLNIRKIFNILIALSFLGFILVRDVFDISVNSYLLVALSVMFFIINDINLTIASMVFMIPLYTGVQYVNIYIIGITTLFFKNPKDFVFKPVLLICTVSILLIEIFSGFTSATLNTTELIRFLFIFILTFIFLPSYNKELNYTVILKAYILGVLFTIVVIMWQYLRVYNISDFFSLAIRVGHVAHHFNLEQGHRVSLDPNLLSIITVFAICSALFLNYRQSVYRLYLFSIPILLVFGFLTQSRTFIFSVVLLFVYYTFASFFKGSVKNVKKAVSSLLVSIILLISTFLIINTLFPQYIINMTTRFEVDDITNGRTEIFQDYNDFMMDNPKYIPFGVGLLAHRQVSGLRSVHNGFQQVFVTWGIIGCFIVAIIMINLYKTATLAKKFEPMHLLPIIMYLFSMQSIQWFSSGGMLLLNIVWFYLIKCLTTEQSHYLSDEASDRFNEIEKSV